jgi:hypothetical protein
VLDVLLDEALVPTGETVRSWLMSIVVGVVHVLMLVI